MTLEDLQPQKELASLVRKKKELLEHMLDRQEIRSSDLVVQETCPCCACPHHLPYGRVAIFEYVRCTRCSLVYLHLRLKEESNNALFSSSPYFALSTRIQKKSFEQRKNKKFMPVLQRISRIVPAEQGKRVLDLGCSTGYFLELIREKTRWHGIGLEIRQEAIEFGHSRGLNIVQGTMQYPCFPDNSFDLVCAFGVLGRSSVPRAVLRECWRMLRPGGILVLGTPNLDGFEFSILGIEHSHFDPLDTAVAFGLNNIQWLLKETGFGIVKAHTPGQYDLEIIRRHVEKYGAKVELNAFVHYLVLGKDKKHEQARAEFTAFLRRHNLSSWMEIFAQKTLL